MKLDFIAILLLLISSCTENNKVESTESYVEINGNKIHYKIDGKGEELIMVHGGYLDLNMWNEQVDEFKSEWKIIRFSDLGHGKTKSKNIPTFGHEIIENITSATYDLPKTLIGLSWGAIICVDYTLKYPRKVDRLILVSPGLNGWDYFQDTIAARNNQLRQLAIKQNDVEKAAKLFHQNWVVGPRRKPTDLNTEFFDKSLEMIADNMENHWMEEWSSLDTIPAIERLEQIEVPTFIIIGNQDAKDIKMIAEEYNSRIPNSRKIVMDNAAHLLNMEQPKAFNRILRQIMNE